VTLSSSSATGTATVTVNSTAASSVLISPKFGGKPWGWTGAYGGLVLAFLVFLGMSPRRRRWQSLVVFATLLAVLGCMAACGAGGGSNPANPVSNPGTTAGKYTFTVTGTGSPSISPAPTTTFVVTMN